MKTLGRVSIQNLSQARSDGLDNRFMLIVLQWNARSLCANGQECKEYIS